MKLFTFVSATLMLATSTFAEDRLDTITLAEFLNSQQALSQQLEVFCSSETKATSNASHLLPYWSSAAVNWSRVQGLQLPAAEFMQTEFSFLFWPDTKDRLKNQVLAASSTKPTTQQWSELPASIKSLSAIEFLLQTEQPQTHCDWYSAIMNAQLKQTNELAALQSFYDFSDIEKITALHGTAMTLHSQLKEVLSREGKPRWVFAPGWRSDTGPNIQNALVQQMQLLLVDFATKHDSVSDWQAQIKAMPALSLESSREQVELVKNFAEALAKFVEIELAPSLNIYLGFNNFDGD